MAAFAAGSPRSGYGTSVELARALSRRNMDAAETKPDKLSESPLGASKELKAVLAKRAQQIEFATPRALEVNTVGGHPPAAGAGVKKGPGSPQANSPGSPRANSPGSPRANSPGSPRGNPAGSPLAGYNAQNGQVDFVFNPKQEFPELTWQEVDKYTALFNEADSDGDKKLNLAELKKLMEKIGAPQTHTAAQGLMRKVDKDGDGEINLREFFSIFQMAKDGEDDGNAGIQQLCCSVETVEVSEVGVEGAKAFFEAKAAAAVNATNQQLELLNKAQAAKVQFQEKKKEAEAEKKRKHDFQARKQMFSNAGQDSPPIGTARRPSKTTEQAALEIQAALLAQNMADEPASPSANRSVRIIKNPSHRNMKP